jgi:hypothetical protein
MEANFDFSELLAVAERVKQEKALAEQKAAIITADKDPTLTVEGTARPVGYVPLSDSEYAALRPALYIRKSDEKARILIDELLAYGGGYRGTSETNQSARNAIAREVHRSTWFIPLARLAAQAKLSPLRQTQIKLLVLKCSLMTRTSYSDAYTEAAIAKMLRAFPIGTSDKAEKELRARNDPTPLAGFDEAMLKAKKRKKSKAQH